MIKIRHAMMIIIVGFIGCGMLGFFVGSTVTKADFVSAFQEMRIAEMSILPPDHPDLSDPQYEMYR